MDARSQDLLEFPLIRARVAGNAAFAPSRRLAERMSPSSDPLVVKRLLDETDQTRDLLSRRPDVGVGAARDISAALQEPIVTLRNGRHVVPVRADAKSRVKGIVHDQSGSGQTLFIEPLVIVELGNAWREAQLAVEAEEERILDELSSLVDA